MQFSTETMVMVSAGVIATLVAIADIFGLIDKIDWVSKRVPKMTLLLLGLLLASQAVTPAAQVEELQASIQDVEENILAKLASTNSSEVLYFRDRAETYRYVADRLRSAKVSVDDITWASRSAHRTGSERKAYEDYVAAMEELCGNNDLVYREVSALATHHYSERSFNLVEQGCANYHLGYHDTSTSRVPLMSYIIIDSEEVILGFYKKPVFPARGETFLSIRDRNVVQVFLGYYEALWQESKKVKEGDVLNLDLIAKVRSSISEMASSPIRPASFSGPMLKSDLPCPFGRRLESSGRYGISKLLGDDTSCLLLPDRVGSGESGSGEGTAEDGSDAPVEAARGLLLPGGTAAQSFLSGPSGQSFGSPGEEPQPVLILRKRQRPPSRYRVVAIWRRTSESLTVGRVEVKIAGSSTKEPGTRRDRLARSGD